MAAIVSDVIETHPDGSTVETVIYSDGSRSVQFTPGPGTPAANYQQMQQKATQAITANVTYLGIATPTAAQVSTQVSRLTRENTAIIRLLLGLLDTTDGT